MDAGIENTRMPRVLYPKYHHEYSLRDYGAFFLSCIRDHEEVVKQELGKVWGASRLLFADSGSVALKVILSALSLPKGSEVAIPCNVCDSIPEAILGVGAKPLFIDIDDNLTLCTADLARKISRKTRVILPVHYMGNICDMDGVLQIASANNSYVVEDLANCIFGYFKGKRVGSFGHASFTSFGFTKPLCVFGGSVILTRDIDLWRAMNPLIARTGGLRRDLRRFLSLIAFPAITDEHLYGMLCNLPFPLIPLLLRPKARECGMSNTGKALILSQLGKAGLIAEQRKLIARQYRQNLEALPHVTFLSRDDPQHAPSYLLFPLGTGKRDLAFRAVTRAGVSLFREPFLLTRLERYRDFHSPCPMAERINTQLLFLPTYPRIGPRVASICAAIRSSHGS